MAKTVCDIYPPAAFSMEAEEALGPLNDVIQDGPNVRPREGYDQRFLRWSYGQLKTMVPMNLDQQMAYLTESKGWFKLNKKLTKERGRSIYTLNPNRPKDEMTELVGSMSAVMKDVVLSNARGVKALAAEFQAKIRNGQDATAEGLRLAKSLRTLSTMGELILGLDQQAGRSLRSLMLRKARQKLGLNTEQVQRIRRPDGQMVEMTEQQIQATSTDALTRVGEMMNDPARQSEALGELMKFADAVEFVNDPMAIGKAGLGLKMSGDMWREMFMNGLLSSPDTLAANASGALWVPIRAYAQGLGSQMIRPVMNAMQAGAGDNLVIESMAKIGAIHQAYGDALRLGWHGATRNRFMYADPEGAMTRAITGSNVEQALGLDLDQGLKSVIDGVGTVINIPSRGLMTADEFAKHLALRGEVAARAIRRAQVAGKDLGDRAQWDNIIRQEFDEAFTIDPLTGSGWFYAQDYDVASSLEGTGKAISESVREGVFQERNEFANFITDVTPGWLRPMIPFVRTPLNILKQGITETTLLGPLFEVGKSIKGNISSPTEIIFDIQKKMLQNPADTARITGQISLMTALGGFLYAKAMSGDVTGGGPQRFMGGAEARRAQMAWEKINVPYSLKVGDLSIPFTRFPEPVAVLMKLYADMGMASAYMSETERDDALAAIALVSVTGLYQSSMLTGVEDLLSIFTGGIDDVDRRLGSAVQRYVATQVPMSSLLAYADRGIDPYKSAYQAPSFTGFFSNWSDLFGNGILGKVADRFPGASANRPLQIDQIGGEPVPIQPGVGPTGINATLANIPLVARKTPSDQAWQAVYDIGMGWTDYKPQGIKLTNGEQAELNRRMGQVVRINGKSLRQAIIELRNRPDVEAYVKAKGAAVPGKAMEIERELNNLKRIYGQAAMSQMTVGNVSLLQRAAIADQADRARELNDVNSVRQLNSQLDELLQRAERGF